MQPIDRPFRFTRDFCVVWVLLAVVIYFVARGWDIGPWYSQTAFFVVAPLAATFFVYGPVLLVRQVIQSGARGWFVVRVLVTTVLVVALFFAVLHFLRPGKEIPEIWVALVSTAAVMYLDWRTGRR